MMKQFEQVFNLERIGNWAAGFIPQLILAVLIFVIFYVLYRLLSAVISAGARRVGMDRTVAGFMLIAVKYIILIFGTMTALEHIGVNVASMIAGLGIVGFSIGFAAKDTLSNIIAGILLFWDKPFVIGDLIEASGEYGQVREMTLRTTRIVTPDGKMVSIPNSLLFSNKIVSYTMEPNLRLDVDFTIGVNEDIQKARELILSLVQGDTRFLLTPPPTVVVTSLGDYFVGLQLRVWLIEERTHITVRPELRERIKASLGGAGIVMPYETIEVVRQTGSGEAGRSPLEPGISGS